MQTLSAPARLSASILASATIPFGPIPFGACSVLPSATVYATTVDREGYTVQPTNDYDACRLGVASLADPAMIRYMACKAFGRAKQGLNKRLGSFDRTCYHTDAEQIVADVVASYYARQSGRVEPNGWRTWVDGRMVDGPTPCKGDVRFSFERAVTRAVQNRNKGTRHRTVVCLSVFCTGWDCPMEVDFRTLKVSEQVIRTRSWQEWAEQDPTNRTVHVHELQGEGKARTESELAAMRGYALPVGDMVSVRDSIRHGQSHQTDTERTMSVLEALGCADTVIAAQTGTKRLATVIERRNRITGRTGTKQHRFVNRRRRVA